MKTPPLCPSVPSGSKPRAEGPFMVADLARRWRCSEQQIHDLIEEGALQAVNIGGSDRKYWRIPVESVNSFEQKRSSLTVQVKPAQKRP